jgi:ABC-type hemin transport system substrate-binding protein
LKPTAAALSIVLFCVAEASHAGMRIITLTPHATEMLFAAGAGEHIVATVDASDFPSQARAIPKLGDGLNTSVEQVLQWQPDWVVGWPSTLMNQLESLGIDTLVLEPRSLEQIAEQVKSIGQRLGTEAKAEPRSQRLRAQADALEADRTFSFSSSSPIRVAILASPDAQFVLGQHALINDALARCGAVNVFAQTLSTAPSVSLESLLAARPAIIFSGYAAPHWLTAQFDVSVIDPNWLYRPGPRFLNAAEQICTKVQQVGQSVDR